MARIVVFSQKHWETSPKDYPEIGRFLGPLSNLTIRFTDQFVFDGDILVQRENGNWFVLPKDVFSIVTRANKVLDIERPWLDG